LKTTIDQIWDPGYEGDFVIKNYGYGLVNLKDREAFLETLKPATDQQRQAKAAATAAAVAIGQTRLQLALSLVDPISYPLLTAIRYLKSVLEAAGVEFIANEPGVRLRKAKT
jgi:hypothetical protein